MNKKRVALFLLLWVFNVDADWGSIGSSVASAGESVGGFLKQMGQGMAGTVPSAYRYNLQVFNGSNVTMNMAIHKVINVLGGRFGHGTGDTATLAPGQATGVMNEHLYFSVGITGGGASFSDPHYTLGIKHDPAVYSYHCYNDRNSGQPAIEMLGAGYTTTAGFSGRIQNKSSNSASVTYTLQHTSNPSDTRDFLITDLDPQSFNFFSIPQGFTIRPSNLVFYPNQSQQTSVIIPATGIAQITDVKKNLSSPACVNYVVNATTGFETGMGPGNFDQPQTVEELRDISPLECQIYNQPASEAAPIGQLMPQQFPWQSVWCVYEEYGWSQSNGSVIKMPMWQIPSGANAAAYLIRPSIARMKSKGPARLIMVRLSLPEKASQTDAQKAQQFLTKLVEGKLYVRALATGAQGTLITQENAKNVMMPTTMPVSGFTMFNQTASFPAYPPVSQTYLGSSFQLNMLSAEKKAELLSLDLSDDIGMLEDPSTGVRGYIMVTDVLTPYGMGAGPCYYLVSPTYVDISQMIGSLANYAVMCNYQGITSSVFTQLVKTFLPQTVQEWVSGYTRSPLNVQDSIASFLVLLGSGNTTKLTQAFTSGKSFYIDSRAESKLSPQGNALLKMLLYGPCSISQLPTYYKNGSAFTYQQSGWPAVTLWL